MAKKPSKKSALKNPIRPPVVTVMGHIDHGKTTLLDALRKTKVQVSESGGITQHIGAYQIEYQGRKITFIDTPGHAAFAAMRGRGAQVTDLVVLVIDAVESVKPQTKECINHIKTAKVPFLIAINKMDLPTATPAIVKKDLSDAGVSVEGYGGDIVTVEISAKTNQNLDQLLEMILLLSDMQELKSDPQANLEATVIESNLDQQKGPVATVIVKKGTLKVGDTLHSPQSEGKVKALYNDLGKKVFLASPGEPVQILGLKKVPAVGSVIKNYPENSKETSSLQPKTSPSLEEGAKTLNIILKADATGTLEAITQNLSDEVTLVSAGIGEINDSDISLAQSTGAKIIGFRVKTCGSALRLAEIEGIFIKSFNLIHELLDDLQQQVLKMLEPTIDEEILGVAKILQEFTIKNGKVAGSEITSGKFQIGDKVHLIRNKEAIGNSKIKSIQIGKDSHEKAKKGEQCGLHFTTDLDFKPKDSLQAYQKI